MASSAPPSEKNAGAKPRPAPKKKPSSFFASEVVRLDVVPDEGAELAKYQRLFGILKFQARLIVVLVLVLIFGMPFFMFAPKQYYSLNPKREARELMSLTMPNMTNAAVVSWVSTSITEIMTFGFGDYNEKITKQNSRFSPEGWKAFTKAFRDMKLGEHILQQHQVITTVPRDTPIISLQGPNKDDVYQWTVQMPVIITFATYNNVTTVQKNLIQLTVVRVPYSVSPMGIAIKNWETM